MYAHAEQRRKQNYSMLKGQLHQVQLELDSVRTALDEESQARAYAEHNLCLANTEITQWRSKFEAEVQLYHEQVGANTCALQAANARASHAANAELQKMKHFYENVVEQKEALARKNKKLQKELMEAKEALADANCKLDELDFENARLADEIRELQIALTTAATKQSIIGTQTDFGMVIVPPAPVFSEEMKQLIAEVALGEDKVDLIPEFIRCKCGQEDDVSNMFDCITCSEYGVCSMCSMRNHRLHEISDSKVNIVHNVVNFCAESNHEKLAKWAREIGSLQNKGGQSYDKLCVLIGSTFTNAYENGSTCDVEGLMAVCDVSVLKQDVENLREANVNMIASVDNLCERLERRKL